MTMPRNLPADPAQPDCSTEEQAKLKREAKARKAHERYERRYAHCDGMQIFPCGDNSRSTAGTATHGMLAAGGFGAGLSIRNNVVRTLATAAVVVPILGFFGYQGGRAFAANNGHLRMDEAKEYIGEKLSKLRS